MGIGSSFHAQETAVSGQFEKTSCYDKWQFYLVLLQLCFQLLECVLECYPNEVASLLGGGYLFGLPLGFVADSIGATIGATAAFILGRTIKHAQHLTPGTADRFHELGIIASVQNLEISCLEKNLDMRLGVVTKETKPGLTVSLLYIILTENLAF
ncbi:uncharacterized protein LOC133823003 isoform X6 [Humulus lupulus]|uniref:uncharacterized protein LOC133823003 isoform X6 n=1 Tax=Humulus lupulus TaxID=3486 RepID=UPI002B406BCA|nr:uncharacterized protein LOC133823003 isoform X6 [Humulus lupulus]